MAGFLDFLRGLAKDVGVGNSPQADAIAASTVPPLQATAGPSPVPPPVMPSAAAGLSSPSDTSIDAAGADTGAVDPNLANAALTQLAKGGMGSLNPLQRQAIGKLPPSMIAHAMKLGSSPPPAPAGGGSIQETAPPGLQTVTPGEGTNLALRATPAGAAFAAMGGGASPAGLNGGRGPLLTNPAVVQPLANAAATPPASSPAAGTAIPATAAATGAVPNGQNAETQTARNTAVNTIMQAIKSPSMTGNKLAEIIAGTLDAFGTAFYGKAGIQHTPLLTQRYQTKLGGQLAQYQAQAEVAKALQILPVQTQNAIRLATAQGDINKGMQIGVTAGIQPYVMQQIMAKLMMESGGTQLYYNPKQAGRQAFSGGLPGPGGGG